MTSTCLQPVDQHFHCTVHYSTPTIQLPMALNIMLAYGVQQQ